MASDFHIGDQYINQHDTVPPLVETRISTWQGPTLPLVKSAGGRFGSKTLPALIQSSILMILGTPLGTAIHSPEFGSSLTELLFEPNDQVLRTLTKQYVINAVSRWEPRVELFNTNVASSVNDLVITIQYLIKDLGRAETLILKAARFQPASGLQVVPVDAMPGGVTS